MADVEKRITEIIIEQLGVSEDQIKPEAKFVEDLGADSLDQVELVMALEEEFDAEIPEEDVDTLQTVGDVMTYITKSQS